MLEDPDKTNDNFEEEKEEDEVDEGGLESAESNNSLSTIRLND